MKQANIIKLFNITRQTWTNWKNEGKPIVELIDYCFDDADIEQFLIDKKIDKYEKIKQDENENFTLLYDLYFNKLDAVTNPIGSSLLRAYFFSFILSLSNQKTVNDLIAHIIGFEDNDVIINEKLYACDGENTKNMFSLVDYFVKIFSTYSDSFILYLITEKNNNFETFINKIKMIHQDHTNQDINAATNVIINNGVNSSGYFLQKSFYNTYIDEKNYKIFKNELNCILNNQPLYNI